MNVNVRTQIRICMVLFILWNLVLGILFLTALPHIGTETEHETNTQMLLVDGYDYTRQIDQILLESLEQLNISYSMHLTEEDSYERQLFDSEKNAGIKWMKFERRFELSKEVPFIALHSLDALNARLAEYGARIEDIGEDYVSGTRILSFQVSYTESVRDVMFNPVIETITIVHHGVLPSHSVTGQTGKVAIVVDDIGYRIEGVEAFIAISRPLTFAVLPYTPYVRSEAARANEAGYTVLLHLPMEPLNSAADPGPFSINVPMSEEEIQQVIEAGLSKVPYAVGVNNHMGSRATSDFDTMEKVLSILLDKGLFFLDSKTTPVSVGKEVAETIGISFTANDFFLDNNSDLEYIKERIRILAKKALRDGYAIGILHDRRGAPQAIAAMVDEIEAAGVELVYIEELINVGGTE
jgi:polysaccharide deacetylase 2 family uncharacterized protein YibQ